MSDLNIQKVAEPEDRSLSVFAEFDQLADQIRNRAFNLFDARGRIHGRAMDDWLEAERQICWPAAELSETDGKYELEVALAGFEPGDIEVTATPSELIVKASHQSKQAEKEKSENGKIRWSDFKSENVYRHVELPEMVDVDHISAEFRNGLLTISAPKLKEKKAASKQIKVSTAA